MSGGASLGGDGTGHAADDAAIDGYLASVRKAMFGVSSRAREGVLEELRAHIKELRAETGSTGAALAQMEEPAKLARDFWEVYGFGPAFGALFCLVAVVLSVLSLPILEAVSYPGLVFGYAFVVAVSVYAGKKMGLSSGMAACVCRVVVVFGIYLSSPSTYSLSDGGSLLWFILGSALLPVAGYLAGETKERYVKGRPVEF